MKKEHGVKKYVVVTYVDHDEFGVFKMTADEIRKDPYRQYLYILEDTEVIKTEDNTSFNFNRL